MGEDISLENYRTNVKSLQCNKWDSEFIVATGKWTEDPCGAITDENCKFRCWERPDTHPADCGQDEDFYND